MLPSTCCTEWHDEEVRKSNVSLAQVGANAIFINRLSGSFLSLRNVSIAPEEPAPSGGCVAFYVADCSPDVNASFARERSQSSYTTNNDAAGSMNRDTQEAYAASRAAGAWLMQQLQTALESSAARPLTLYVSLAVPVVSFASFGNASLPTLQLGTDVNLRLYGQPAADTVGPSSASATAYPGTVFDFAARVALVRLDALREAAARLVLEDLVLVNLPYALAPLGYHGMVQAMMNWVDAER